MKYLCLVYNEEKKLDALSKSEWDALVGGALAYDEELRKKGHFIGFILIDARDLNEAIQVASKIPSARLGSIEVRPIRELDAEARR